MKKYLVLYMAPLSSFDNSMKMSKEDMKKGMEAWRKWMKESQKFLVEGGSPLGKTKRVSPDGITDTRNMIGGYSIIQANSFDEAAKLFKNHPHFMMPEGFVEIMEFSQMPEM